MLRHPSWRILIILALSSLLSLCGCSESSGSSSGANSPLKGGTGATAGSGAGSGSTGSTPATGGSTGTAGNTANGGAGAFVPGTPTTGQFSMGNVTPASAARWQLARDVANQELEDLWNLMRPDIEVRLQNEAVAFAAAGTLAYQAGPVNIGVTDITGLILDAQEPPEFTSLSNTQLGMQLPRNGVWRITLNAEIGLSLAGLGINLIGIPVSMEIILSATLNATLNDTDPTRPRVASSGIPVTYINASLSSTNALVQPYLPYLSTSAAPIVQQLLQLVLGTYVSFTLQSFPGDVWADGAPPLTDSGIATPFEEIAINVDKKIREDHMPHGLLHRIEMDTPVDDEPWDVAYLNGGPQNTGNVTGYSGESDSAIHTGYYLASQAFRYASTGDPEALDNLQYTLDGVGKLLDINGGTGLLARNAAPMNSQIGQHIISRGHFGQTQLNGQTWVGWQSDSGVSRDQYSGIVFGLGITHEIVNDPAVQAECALRIRQIMDYLIAENWIVVDDRPNWTQAGGAGPTVWTVQSAYQQLGFLTIGERLNPGRYAAEIQRLDGLAPFTWLGAWISVNQLDGYYKFNLQMLNAYNYFRLETDQQRWMEMARGYRIVQRWVGHHHNPHFDMIQSAIDPALQTSLFPSVRESLRLFLTRNHRDRVPPGLDLSVIQWADFTFGSLSSPLGNTETVPTAPIPIPLRKYTGYFQWQKQPSREAVRQPTNFGAFLEKPGIDVDLPYWMGRWHGAF